MVAFIYHNKVLNDQVLITQMGVFFFKEWVHSDLIVLILLAYVAVLFISKTDSQDVLPEFLEINMVW